MSKEWTDNEKYTKPKKLAAEHWSYVEASIRVTDPDMPERYLTQMKFHYTTAATHFYAHGVEDAERDV